MDDSNLKNKIGKNKQFYIFFFFFTGLRSTNIISKLYDVFKKIYVLEITIYQNIELENMNKRQNLKLPDFGAFFLTKTSTKVIHKNVSQENYKVKLHNIKQFHFIMLAFISNFGNLHLHYVFFLNR